MLFALVASVHCWDYRRFVVAASGVTAADEFAYTTAKINQNFSNFSAWHYRTKLVPRVCTTTEQLLAALDADLQLIQQAYYTEPDDQSAWLYHRWLLLTARQSTLRVRRAAALSEYRVCVCGVRSSLPFHIISYLHLTFPTLRARAQTWRRLSTCSL